MRHAALSNRVGIEGVEMDRSRRLFTWVYRVEKIPLSLVFLLLLLCNPLRGSGKGSVPERSALRLADAVLQILNEPDGLLTKAQVEGPAFVAQRFGYERMVRETIEIYGADLAGRRNTLSF